LIVTSSVDNVYAGISNVYKCNAPANEPGTCGTRAAAPDRTLNTPSLSKKILSILGK